MSLAEARLYGILDLGYVVEADLERTAERLCVGGVDVLQLRAKNATDLEIEEMARRVEPIVSAAGIPFLLNDFPELVPSTGASGAHVGQDDLSVQAARWRAGRSLGEAQVSPIIGKSTHSLMQAVAAEVEGADYLGFGPLYPTGTKPGRPAIGLEEIRKVHELVKIPIFCIGGVNLRTLPAVVAAGAQRVVIVSALLQAPDMTEFCREARAMLAG